MQGAWLYILASKPRGTLYVGVTNDIVRRLSEHRDGLNGFTSRYDIRSLVYCESHATMPLAIQREKNIKHWSRAWKLSLIEGVNPQWREFIERFSSLNFIMDGRVKPGHDEVSKVLTCPE